MEVVLVMYRVDGDRRSFPINRELTLIGRQEDCDLRIPVGEVSRKHCRILKQGASLRVEDMGSSNGTLHNGQRVQTAELLPGDSVRVGPVVFVVQINGQPPDAELKPFLDRQAQSLSDSVAPPVVALKSAQDALSDGELQVIPEPEPEGETADDNVQLFLDPHPKAVDVKAPKK
jgi:pSer/pThr/pTyr-binding forkhead associated (FHA) protein